MIQRLLCNLIVLFLAVVVRAADKPNVLFIAVDDLKPILGCYGDTTVKTPQIDRLAARGTTFLNAHCQQAVCGPSRASLLTGLGPDRTGVWDLKTRMRDVHPDVLALPQYFRQHGYETVGMGKIYDPRCVDGDKTMDKPSWSRPYVQIPSNPDGEYGLLNPELIADIRKRKRAAQAEGITNWSKVRKMIGGTPATEGSEDVPDNAYYDGLLADTAVDTLKELAVKDQPFFLAVGFKKPHLPFVAPKKYWDLYDRGQFSPHPFQEMPANAPAFAFQDSWELRNGTYKDGPKTGPIPDETQTRLIHGYYACVSYIDAQVGKLLDALEASGKAEQTVIVLWGDHGWHLGDHGMWCKHTNYEQATRAPLIFAAPQVGQRGAKSQSPVDFIDIFPTLCALAGLPVPEVLEGKSLVPILNDADAMVKEVALSQYHRNDGGKPVMGYAYRSKRYRYIEWVQKDFYAGETAGPVVARELYDYEKDPMEKRNRIDDPSYAPVVEQMQKSARARPR